MHTTGALFLTQALMPSFWLVWRSVWDALYMAVGPPSSCLLLVRALCQTFTIQADEDLHSQKLDAIHCMLHLVLCQAFASSRLKMYENATQLTPHSPKPDMKLLLAGGAFQGFMFAGNLGRLGNSIAIWLGIQPYELFFYVFLPPLLMDAAVRIDFFLFKKARPRPHPEMQSTSPATASHRPFRRQPNSFE